MKITRSILIILISLIAVSCGNREKGTLKQVVQNIREAPKAMLPIDKGFSEYITGYTSGIVPANSVIEVRFTPEFAAKAGKQTPIGLFSFIPLIKGRAEWIDETTLIFRPAGLLDPGKTYTGELNLFKLCEVKERLRVFPVRIQTMRKDFTITTGLLECPSPDGKKYTLNGELAASDYIKPEEVEGYLEARLEKRKLGITWDHSDNLIHKFTIENIERTPGMQELKLVWDGTKSGIKQKGSSSVAIPPADEFSVLNVKTYTGENQKIEIIFSDPLDASRDLTGLVYIDSYPEPAINVKSNIVTLIPSVALEDIISLNVDQAVKNSKGEGLISAFSVKLDFTAVNPGIMFSGNGVIVPSSRNLIFPFKAANLKAVDLKIIKIYENNLPYFLQEGDINSGYYVKRFGRPVYSGRVDLVPESGSSAGGWKLYTIDLADYIDVEPGILYKVSLGMRKSYALLSCPVNDEEKRYEELLDQAQQATSGYWDDPDNYYEDNEEALWYSSGFLWEDRDDPCKGAYYSPDKNISRNILASNLGLLAKRGEDDILHVTATDLITALPVSEVTIDAYDFQMQLIISGNTNQDGTIALYTGRKPFLIIARKDKDRNYLKINDGSSLSLSSFDVSGTQPEDGIKAFIYGERDVWRPGDSIYLSLLVRDMKSGIPSEHPVQFELVNPLGQRVDNQIHKMSGNNLLVFSTKTSPDAVTGNYNALFKIGGASFTKRIRIETIKPNRLKIDFRFPSDILGGSGRISTGTLNVKWLNGSVARNLKASVDLILKKTRTEFNKYGQYTFDDPVSEFYSETVTVFDNAVDENGNAFVRFDPGSDIKAPGMLNAVFTVKVQEQGGDESITQASYKYAPYPVFVGINLPALKENERMLFTDAENEVKVITVDEKGKPVSSAVEYSVYKLSYRWWWESDEENLGYYISNQTYQPVVSGEIRTSGGEGSFTFKIDKNEWGRYLIRAEVPSGHATGRMVLIDWPWEYGMKRNAEGATLLAVSADKEKYNPGDEVRLSFPSPENSMAVVTLENATGVLEEIHAPTTKATTEVRFKARKEMAPNVYAYVTVIQPHNQSVNDMPVRLYGIIPVMVEDPETRLEPQVSMADEIRSQRPFEIKVSEANRRPMTYTIAVVDEGLLDITGFKTPDPWNYFYAREALGVKTWDIYDYVLGAFGGTLERLFAVGGDETVLDKSAHKAQRFKPVVKFLGPFSLAPGKINSHTVILPRYTGSVRTMVIAGSDRAFGTAEKQTLVKDPLMVLVTAPRVVSPGEKATLPVTVFVQKDNIKDVSLTAESNDLIKMDEGSMIAGGSGTGERDTEFAFAAGEKTGIARIKVTASGGGETAVYDMEIEVRSPNPPETRTEMKILNPGEKWEKTFAPFGIEGSNSAMVEISRLPSVNLEKRMDYLISYPHGCSEQITSAAFPQLWLSELTGNKQDIAQKTSVNIKEAINKLASRQMVSGGIALWPGSYQPDNWVTSYTGHFIVEAEKLGYIIPSSFRQNWINYQKKTAREWRYDTRYKYSSADQAYRLFTLALAGQPERGAMNRLRETDGLPRLSVWLLAAAYATDGKPEIAGDLLDIRNTVTETEYSGYYYGSQLRDRAIILYTLTLLKNQEQSLLILKELCDNLNRETWFSTQSLAWGLFSYMKFAETLPADKNIPANTRINFNGESGDHAIGSKQIVSINLKLKSGSNVLQAENVAENPVYLTLVRKGIPLISDFTMTEKGISMKIDYVNMNLSPVDHKNLVQGTDFMMIVKVSNNSFENLENIALSQMVPSGWEIQNTRLFEAERGIRESKFDYRDFRDDRVYTYFGLARGETKTFILILNAAYKGTFNQPATLCEAMYTENCYSRHPGAQVKVTGQ